MNAVELCGLTRSFHGKTAVEPLQLSLHEGELFALLGLNGAGKTTTLRMLSGLLPPDGGDALLLGHSICREPQAAKANLNLSPQETAVAPNLTARENLCLTARIWGISRTEAHRRAEELLTAFSLTDKSSARAKTLSGGQQRRLSLAMALMTRPHILLLDEPTLGLDVLARRELWQQIRALHGQVTILLTTHYLEEAEALADRIGIMSRGRLTALGTVEELKAQAGCASFPDAFITLATEGGICA